MSSTLKTLDLLSYFSTVRPEIGLSQLCRIAKRDKATTYRYLQSLESAGFVEQNPDTKMYRLGPALLHLAQIREATVPRKDGALPALARLADATGETAHVTVLSGTTLYALASCESPRHSIRAIIDITTFPLHATASGLTALAFGPKELMKCALSELKAFTPGTPTSPSELEAIVDAARKTGIGFADQSYETDIKALSAPLFDQTGLFAGTVAVASVASRFTPALDALVKSELVTASRNITHSWGGKIPADLEAAWAATLLSPSNTLEPAS